MRTGAHEVDVHGYERTAVGEVWDDNWLKVGIRVLAGGFRGNAWAAILAGELTKFLSQLQLLHQSLTGAAEFISIEGQLGLHLVGDGKGHIQLRTKLQTSLESAIACTLPWSLTSHSWERLFVNLNELQCSFQSV